MPAKTTEKNVRERFWRKVDKTEECWWWIGATDSAGRGTFWDGSRTVRAYRWAWAEANGPIPDGMLICHHCDNGLCVNPKHLFLGTHADNSEDAYRKGRLVGLGQPGGAAHGQAKLTWEDVDLIRGSDISATELARRLGVSAACIYDARAGRTYMEKYRGS